MRRLLTPLTIGVLCLTLVLLVSPDLSHNLPVAEAAGEFRSNPPNTIGNTVAITPSPLLTLTYDATTPDVEYTNQAINTNIAQVPLRLYEEGTGQTNSPVINSVSWSVLGDGAIEFRVIDRDGTLLKDFSTASYNGPYTLDLDALDGTPNELLIDFKCTQPGGVTGTTSYNQTLEVNTNTDTGNGSAFYTVQCDLNAANYESYAVRGGVVEGTPLTIPPTGVATAVGTGNPLIVETLDDTSSYMVGSADSHIIQLVNSGQTPLNITATVQSPTPGLFQIFDETGTGVANTQIASGGGSKGIHLRCDPTVVTYPSNPPPATAQYTGTVTITNLNAPNVRTNVPIEYAIRCDVTGTPDIEVYERPFGTTNNNLLVNEAGIPFEDPANSGTIEYDLGGVQINFTENAGERIFIGNTGNTNLTISNFAITPADGRIKIADGFGSSLTVTVGEVPLELPVVCNPQDQLTYTAELTFTYNSGGASGTTSNVGNFTLTCNGLPRAPVYESIPNPQTLAFPGSYAVNFGNVPENTVSTTETITIYNTGTANTRVRRVDFAGGSSPSIRLATPAGQTFQTSGSAAVDVTLPTNDTQTAVSINTGVNMYPRLNIRLECEPSSQATFTAILEVEYETDPNDTAQRDTKYYHIVCNGVQADGTPVPLISSTSLSGVTNSASTATITVQNTGAGPLDVTGASISPNDGNARVTPTTLGTAVTVNGGTTSGTIFTVECGGPGSSVSPQTQYTVTVQTTDGNAQITFNCTVTSVPTAQPNLGVSPTSISLADVPLGTGGKSQTVTLSETGTGNIVVTSVTLSAGSGTTDQLRLANFSANAGATLTNNTTATLATGQINEGSGTTITFDVVCSSNTSASYSGTATITWTGTGVQTTNIQVNCTVVNATATPIASLTPTPLPAIPPTSLTQCEESLILSTPFPQNASGEFLFTNCFRITTAGTVNVSLAQVLTNINVSEQDQASIRANPALISFWRMGSWFLTPSEYNVATQTYSFQSAAGTNVYGVFYGGITLAVGSQGNTPFAGTTTGNVEDAVRAVVGDDTSTGIPFAAILATLAVLFIGAIYVTRRNQKDATA